MKTSSWREITSKILRRSVREIKAVPGVFAIAQRARNKFPRVWSHTVGRLLKAANQEPRSAYANRFNFSSRSEVPSIGAVIEHTTIEPVDVNFLSMKNTAVETESLLKAINLEISALLSAHGTGNHQLQSANPQPSASGIENVS